MRNIFKPRTLSADTCGVIPLINVKLFGYRVVAKAWHWNGKFPLKLECRRVNEALVVNVPIGRYFEVDLLIRKENTNA